MRCIQQDACTVFVISMASLYLRMRWFPNNLRKQTTTRATEVLKKRVRVRGLSSDANKLERKMGSWLKTRLIMAARWHACVRLSEMAVCKTSGLYEQTTTCGSQWESQTKLVTSDKANSMLACLLINDRVTSLVWIFFISKSLITRRLRFIYARFSGKTLINRFFMTKKVLIILIFIFILFFVKCMYRPP